MWKEKLDTYFNLLNLIDITTVKVDGSNELQVGVYSPNAVDISTVL